MAKQLAFSRNSSQKILRGVNLLADAVKVTFGPKGRNVAVEKKFGQPIVTKDGHHREGNRTSTFVQIIPYRMMAIG